jgi:hypothetical protein
MYKLTKENEIIFEACCLLDYSAVYPGKFYQRFGGACCLDYQGVLTLISWKLKLQTFSKHR